MEPTVNLLEYLQSKTQVDCDSLNLEVAKTYGPFGDCTSNQADSYYEFLNPERADLLKKSAARARDIHHDFPDLKLEELAVELCMVSVTLTVVPFISGNIHVMANPSLSYSTPKIVENAKRISKLCHLWDTKFDLSRLVIKVPATWEGLQACRELKSANIKTLATTLFTMEQAILAAEVGCVSVSPFVHELKVHFDEKYHDIDPIFGLCVEIQRYFQEHSYPTRVKACSLVNVDEVMTLAGVAALTLPPALLQALKETEDSQKRVSELSLFIEKDGSKTQVLESSTFVNDEAKFRNAFSTSDGGRGKLKTEEAIDLFCEFQTKAEDIMKSLLR